MRTVPVEWVLVLTACVVMWVGAFSFDAQTRRVTAVNWMVLSFALLLTAYLVGGGTMRFPYP